MVGFQRPTGATADLSELEYISALLQTQSGSVRKDGSIETTDVQLFLQSRYGIHVSQDDLRRTVMDGFGGGDVIDLSELASMLLIPTLVKATTCHADKQNIVGIQPGLIQQVLDMILHDVTGSKVPPKLTKSLLQEILLAYGEEELSNDRVLLEEMIRAAGTEDDDLDADTFTRALTSDVLLYNVDKEDTLTTNYSDVMATKTTDDDDDDDDHLNGYTNELSLKENEDSDDDDYLLESGGNKASLNRNNKGSSTTDPPVKIDKFFSTPAIDFTACRYSSKFIVVFLWSGFVISYIAYFGPIVQEETQYIFNDWCVSGSFGCRIGLAILQWLFVLATLCGFGLFYVAIGSIGNGIEEKRKWTRLIAAMCMGALTWICFLFVYRPSEEVVGTIYAVDEQGNIIYEEDFVAEQSQPYEAVVYYISAILGTVVMVLHLYMLLGETIRKRCLASASERVIRFFTSTGIKAESGNKKAAAVKMDSLVKNARQVHSYSAGDIAHGETSFGAGLLNFAVHGEGEPEEVGGFLWTWKKLFNRELYDSEGVWISARLLAGNFSQLLISGFVLTYGVAFTRTAVEEWQKGKENPARYLYLALEWLNVYVPIEDFAQDACSFATDISNGVLNASGIILLSVDNTTCATLAQSAINRTIENVSNDLYPQEQYMVQVPMIVATAMATFATLALVVVYLPSVASTVLQFRTGVIPFFQDDVNFELYRNRLDLVTILLGSMFWSALYAAGLVGVIIGVIVFLFLWQATRQFFINLLAVLIALCCTIGIKILISVFLLRTAYAAFYRKKVNQVNIVSLALEAIMIGFAIGTALARAFKIVLISVLYIGRIDTPLLAPGVGIGPLMDRYPFIFRQDILTLEAHRHPYIDLIGKLQLLKLQHGDRFATRAGFACRLIFTVALLPWLRKYRVIARPELADGGGGGFNPTRSVMKSSSILPRSSILFQSSQMASIRGEFLVSSANSGNGETPGGHDSQVVHMAIPEEESFEASVESHSA